MKRTTGVVLVLVVLCGLGALLGGAFNGIISQAEAAFGPAAPTLNPQQKLLLAWRLSQNEAALTKPVNPFGAEKSFQIELGEPPTVVAQRLENENLIQDAGALLDLWVYTGLDTRIQAGDYTLSPASPAQEIAYALLDATPAEVPFAILPGWRLEEIAASLPSSGLQITPALFLAETQKRHLEGYLLPGIYTVPRTITLNALLEILSTTFDKTLTPEIRTGFDNQGLSVDDAVRLASIIEREAVVDNERALIASVFLNRLAIGMKLEADPTVQYAVGFNTTQNTWWSNPLTRADLAFDSPYNTYRYPGLPPGAICSPSLASLKAVALPAQTPYYYFRAACDSTGAHNFAETYDEHVHNACP